MEPLTVRWAFQPLSLRTPIDLDGCGGDDDWSSTTAPDLPDGDGEGVEPHVARAPTPKRRRFDCDWVASVNVSLQRSFYGRTNVKLVRKFIKKFRECFIATTWETHKMAYKDAVDRLCIINPLQIPACLYYVKLVDANFDEFSD